MTIRSVRGDWHVQSSKCQLLNLDRCEQAKSRCIVREKARPRRAQRAGRAGNPPKFDDSSLSSTASPSTDNPSREGEFSLDLPTTVYQDPIKDAESLQHHHKRILKDDSRSPTPSREILHLPPRYISGRKLTLSQATHLLNSYIPKLPFFPFVTLPADPTIPTLSQQFPFLLLAILTTAAIPHPYLHHQLDQEFRRVLSLKLIVESQKSLDYLLGLLVYIAWYPVHTKPKLNPCFTYMNLANSLALDLGLDQAEPRTHPFREFDLKGLVDNDGGWTIEAKKAYMGCYVLGSRLSQSFNKPQIISYENLLPSNGDSFIPSLTSTPATAIVILERISDRINDTWTAKNYPQMDVLSTELYVQVFTAELDTWKRNVPESLTVSPLLALYHTSTHLSVYSHALRLLRRPYRPFIPGTTEATPSPDHLHTCLRLGASYLHRLLSLPTLEYTHFNLIHWSQLVHSLVTLVRLTFIIAHVENWSAETTRERVGLSMYLDALCFRLHSLSSNSQSSSPAAELESDDCATLDASRDEARRRGHVNKYLIMHNILSTLKKSWEQRVDAIVPKSATISRGKCPMFDPGMATWFEDAGVNFDIGDDHLGGGMMEWHTNTAEPGTERSAFSAAGMKTPGDGDAGVSVGSGGNGTVGGAYQHGSGGAPFHNLWATMTCSWAEQSSGWPILADSQNFRIGGNEGVFGYQMNEG
ncbi:hypothetical protein DSL72_001439 [Monilinia vaccinii-corymbosi]|uniref:Transcription factor domain-containing protein n=1 Tax=Monilinia vaccinii-corymbosi TaxID=61207 RepID=A0A8A3P4V2_9HELO|nr:hypothetical protein DSL72_001439 [Monilinia vaccinii-corymbosi]